MNGSCKNQLVASKRFTSVLVAMHNKRNSDAAAQCFLEITKVIFFAVEIKL